MSDPTAYPLCWPDFLPRARSREAGQFKTSLAAAIGNVQASLRKFAKMSGKDLKGLTISSGVTLGVNRPTDPGVAVWFTWDDLGVCIAVDRYSSVEANLQAIHHVLEARCTELRHGTLALTRATMTGFLALPAPEPWWQTMGLLSEPVSVTLPARKAVVEQAFKEAARKAHPDQGGSADTMARVNAARVAGHRWAEAQ